MCRKKVVIIGGGVGGLFAGAFLSKEGYDVTVVEKNSTIGGGLQSFQRFGETFDTGMHVIGGMHSEGNLYKMCKYLGILDKINLKQTDDTCSDEVFVASDNKKYKIAKGKDGFINSLSEYFPHQRKELEQYVEAMIALTEEVDLFYLRKPTISLFYHSADFMLPVDEFIAKYITDEKLRVVLAFHNLLYAGEAGVTPAFIHAIISILYLNDPMRFIDGTSHFAEALGEVIKINGGTIIRGEKITKIHVEGKRVVSCETSTGKSIEGDCYISAIHPSAFLELVEDKGVFTKSYRNRLEHTPNSYSAMVLNIKLKPNTIEYINYTGHYFSNNKDAWKNLSDIEQWPNICLYMTPPVKNQSKYASTLNLIAPMNWEEVKQWEDTTCGRRGEDYIEWKKLRAKIVLQRMTAVFPNLLESIEGIDIATPLTIRDFYGVKHGALYGYKKDCNNMIHSKVSIKTKLTNLFLTGQNHNLHGLCGVSLTAIETCNMILGDCRLLDNINNA